MISELVPDTAIEGVAVPLGSAAAGFIFRVLQGASSVSRGNTKSERYVTKYISSEDMQLLKKQFRLPDCFENRQ
jgi:hypothetical protein